MQAMNELSPRIVHFSGHGSMSEELVLQTAEGTTKFVSKQAIVMAMATGSDNIDLVVFNACFSEGQAEAVVEHVDAAIGMTTAIGDIAARVFAAQLYSALGFGKSVKAAFDQARAALLLEGIAEDQIPRLFARTGINLAELIVVQPGDNKRLL